MRHRDKFIAVALLACTGIGVLAAPAPDKLLLDESLDDYLRQRSLIALRVYGLEKRLPSTSGPERTKLLWDLASSYEALLESLPIDQRAAVRERCRALLKDNPRPELAALRINLLKAEYLNAERDAELQRLRVGSQVNSTDAVQTLKRLAIDFNEIAVAANAKVRSLEQQEQARPEMTAAESKDLQEQLQESKRSRSLAHYYAGWSDVYIAQLTRDRAFAGDALVHFGSLLNAQDHKPPTLDRLPRSLLIHEHVARACLGTAAAYSIIGNDAEALRWLDELSTSDSVPAAVRSQILARRIAILGAGSRWNELSTWVQRARAPLGKVTSPLEVGDAVLLAVTTLEGENGPEPGGEQVRTELGRSALADLIARAQVGYVVTLAKHFGTGALASEGFVAQYVRALQAFENARALHRSAGKADDAAKDSAIVLAYREAAALFLAAAKAQDASSFEKDAGRAAINAGMSLFYAGDFVQAADEFERAARSSKDEAVRRDAMWYEVVSLDRAFEGGRKELSDRRDAAAVLYVSTFPKTEQAARLLLRRAGVGKFTDSEVVETLLAVPDSSPVRHESRVLAASLLFKLQRNARAADLDDAIHKYLLVVDQVFPAERDNAIGANGQSRPIQTERVLTLCRQQLEAAMLLSTPDLPRAEKMLSEISRIAELTGADISSIRDELAFRKLQVANAKGDDNSADGIVESLKDSSSAFAQAARQAHLRRAIEQSRAAPDDQSLAKRVVVVGESVVASLDQQKLRDPRSNAIRDDVAGAAAFLYRKSGSPAHRDLAIKIDTGMFENGGRFTSSLRRLAELSEQAGDSKTALECWRLLVAGLRDGQQGWFEASYNAIRLQAQTDPNGASDAMRLFELSYPDFGPPAWADKFRKLRNELPASLPVIAPLAPSSGGGS